MSQIRRALIAALAATCLIGPLAATTPAHAAGDYVRPDPGAGHTYDPNRILVRFKTNATASAIGKIAHKHDMVKTDHLDAANVDLFNIGTDESPATVATNLSHDPSVALAEPDYDLRTTGITNDSLVDQFWNLDNFGQTIGGQAGISGIDTKAPGAWNTSTGSGVIVAVIDEGIDINHPELASHIWTNAPDCLNDGIDHEGYGFINDCHGWNFYDDNNSVFDASDGDDHGTHVAGSIAASANNGVGGAGVAPGVTIMPLKFMTNGFGSTSDAISAIQYAKDHGARIVNCSWGGTGYSQALKDAMANSGMLFTLAAGNSSANLSTQPEYPAAFGLPNAITVAAIDNRGALASFSNRGGPTSLAAPGVNILSSIPRRINEDVAVEHNPVGGQYQSAFWGFGLEAVVGGSARAQLLNAEVVQLGGAATTTPITIVDDDESSSGSPATPDTAGYYTAALATAGYTNVNTIDVARDADGPAASTLAGHIVIWETGYAIGHNTTTLSTGDMSQLTTFLNNGGHLLVAGADAIYQHEFAPFVENYLGVNFRNEGDTRTATTGVSSTSLDGMTFNLSGAESPKHTLNPYQDTITPWDSSTSAVLQLNADADYTGAYGYMSGTSMAAPQVAGVAALVAQILPGASAGDIAAVVEEGVSPLASLHGVTATGGTVNAANSVALAVQIATPPPDGYRFVARDGGIFSFGNASFRGSTGGQQLNQPVVGMADTTDRSGYWLVARDGGIFSFNAPFKGSAGGIKLNSPIVGMAATPSGQGYWLVATDGGIFTYGDASFQGSTGASKLNSPVVAMAATPNGLGYWLVAADGGVFAFGDAGFHGSAGGLKLNKPIVGMTATPSGNGYWLVASDGGIFSYGDAAFYGSTGGIKLNQPITSIATTADGGGYWLVATDGGVFAYGDAGFFGSTGSNKLNQPIVSISH